MRGRMMDFPLTLTHFVERAATFFPRSEIVSRLPDGTLHRYTYAEMLGRARKLANALTTLGVRPGDRVATLCWNHARHLEAYVAIPCMGAVLHTLNLRLSPSDLGYIANHAEDSVVLVDESLLPCLREFIREVPSLKTVIVLRDGEATPLEPGELDYEALLAAESSAFTFERLDENDAAILCYTSGTTGRPKGVAYSHRSTTLHTLGQCLADTHGIGHRDTAMPVVPMFHACAWGMPYACLGSGSKMVFPGPRLDAHSLLELIGGEQVTFTAGVPTVWLAVLAALDEEPGRYQVKSLRTVVVGGAAAPPALIEGLWKRHGVPVSHAWGMTEMSPIGTVAHLKTQLDGLDEGQKLAYRASQGFAIPLVEQRHVDEDSRILPWDGKVMGELEVRGPWVASSYMGDEGKDRFTVDGWFKTGDVVTIDPEGYVRICDRSKDVIKSGGEWISSVELENALMSHPKVLEAAVFAGKHPKWDERPVAAVVVKKGQAVTEDELRAHLAPNFAKFWLPDAYVFVDQVPRTSTGKFLKTKLRELYGNVFMSRT